MRSTNEVRAIVAALSLLGRADRRVDWSYHLILARRIADTDSRQQRINLITTTMNRLRTMSLIFDLAIEQPWKNNPDWTAASCRVFKRHEAYILMFPYAEGDCS